VFSDSFLLNLALFVAGQAAAWFYLRTGRLWLGGIGTAMLWIAADWAVMAKYVFADVGPHFRGALVTMQATAVVTVVALALAQWRRRWSDTARKRPELFTAGMTAYLHGAHDSARKMFRRLVRNDPWDAGAWLALGNVHGRQRQPKAAKRCYRRCLRVDLAREYTDLANRLLAGPKPIEGTDAAEPQEPQSTLEPAASSLKRQPARS
jgi:tetratricopeptide (TPR) repeat protein